MSRHRSRQLSVYEYLLSAIIERRIPAGERITEAEIERTLNVSRTPVREAMYQLVSEGLVEEIPGVGKVVRSPGTDDIRDLLQVRSFLDGGAARLAARHADDAEIDMMEAMATRLGDETKWAGAAPSDLDMQYHVLIVRASRNRYLEQRLVSILRILRLVSMAYETPQNYRHEEASAEHMSILEAIRLKNDDLAEARARSHIRNSVPHYMEIYRTMPEPLIR